MKTTIAIFSFILFCSTLSFAQSLRVNDPQNRGSFKGTIEETKITYEPQGLYMNVDWEITFSARGIEEFAENDTIEVDYSFYLPEGAMVYDSKLWFEDTILTAMIIDRWTASRVYENIVNRRKDPSILYKNGPNFYNLRIFPMAAKESRKVRLSFLMPATWTTKNVSATFLSRNLLVSNNPIGSINFYVNAKSPWTNPVLKGIEEIPVERLTNPENEATHYANIHFKQIDNSQIVSFDAPLDKGIFLSFFEENNDKFYQLALAPSEGMNLQKPRKVLFLIDYEKGNTALSQTEMWQSFSAKLIDLFNEKDSFNLIYPGDDIKLAAENWVPGTPDSITTFFENLGKEPIVSYDNVASLLKKGIDFVQANKETKLVLLANSDKLSDINEANELIDELLEKMEETIPVYIGDYQNNNFYYQWVRNENYRGNEYFYRNLAKLTGGDYIHAFDGDNFKSIVQKIFHLATNENNIVDIHTSLENGFCYGRFNFENSEFKVVSGVYLETGRYSGSFPFRASVSGLYSNEIFSKTISVSKNEAWKADSLAGKYWYGNEIAKMVSVGYNYSVINDIIEKSIKNRILCTYTAFLCLEPGMMKELDNLQDDVVFNRGWEDGAIVTAEDFEKNETNLKVYPNPFSDRIHIELQLPQTTQINDVSMVIYDLFGKKIKEFDTNNWTQNSLVNVIWNASDQNGNGIPKGTYILICTTPEKRISRKLVLM